MRAVQLDYADPDFPARLVEVDEPQLPAPDWARLAVTRGGICGSDLHFFQPDASPTPLLLPYVALPIDLGHEVVGTVVDGGAACPVPVGTRVAVDPVVSCVARDLRPTCPHCAAGHPSVCHHLAAGALTPGFGLGFTSGLGGGWSEQVVAHTSMLHPLPTGLADDAAVLHEPLSIAFHGLLSQPPPVQGTALVVGAGVIGLCVVSALRSLCPDLAVTVLAKYAQQAEAARRLGATTTVLTGEDAAHREELAAAAGTKLVGGGDLSLLAGGFSYVVEAVGTTRTVDEALRCADGRSVVVLLGATGVSQVDLTPVWFKELRVVGALNHGVEDHDGARRHSVDRALDLLAAEPAIAEQLVTHVFPLERFDEAIATALNRAETGARKVVLTPLLEVAPR